MAISLANPPKLWNRLQELFADVALVRQTDRFFTIDEYESMEKGLFSHLSSLRSSGVSDFAELENGRYTFRNLFIRAIGLKGL